MKQTFLDQAKLRLDHLKDLEQQVEETKKQIKNKECEIANFKQEWVNNCKHVFYRIQELSGCVFYTTGYHCCLCGKYEKLQRSKETQLRQTRCVRVSDPWKHYAHPKPYFPPPHEETQEFIGTVIDGPFSDCTESDEERFPIPPEYQAEVDSKKAQLNQLIAEKDDLVEKLKQLEETVKATKSDLDSVSHLLNNYFHHPEIVERPPFHWSRDDFNYDPFD